MSGNFLKGTVGTEPSAETKVLDKKNTCAKGFIYICDAPASHHHHPPPKGGTCSCLTWPTPILGAKKRWNNFCWFSSSKEKKDWKAGCSATTSFKKWWRKRVFLQVKLVAIFGVLLGQMGQTKSELTPLFWSTNRKKGKRSTYTARSKV